MKGVLQVKIICKDILDAHNSIYGAQGVPLIRSLDWIGVCSIAEYITCLYGSGGNVLSFGYMATSASPKSSGGGFLVYSSTSGLEGFKFGLSKGGI